MSPARFRFRCRAAALAALLAVVATGCASFSGITAASGRSPAFDEDAHRETVPMPGYSEHLEISLHPYGVSYSHRSSSSSSSSAATAPPDPGPMEPRVGCQMSQIGESTVYTRAYHYGSKWKWATGVSFLVEAGLSALLLLSEDVTLTNRGLGVFLGVDAVATGALFFVPKREVLKTDTREDRTPLHRHCPEGLVLEAGGRTIPVGPRGVVPEASLPLLGQAIAEGHPVIARMGPHRAEVDLSEAQRCAWAEADEAASGPPPCAPDDTPARTQLLILDGGGGPMPPGAHAAR